MATEHLYFLHLGANRFACARRIYIGGPLPPLGRQWQFNEFCALAHGPFCCFSDDGAAYRGYEVSFRDFGPEYRYWPGKTVELKPGEIAVPRVLYRSEVTALRREAVGEFGCNVWFETFGQVMHCQYQPIPKTSEPMPKTAPPPQPTKPRPAPKRTREKQHSRNYPARHFGDERDFVAYWLRYSRERERAQAAFEDVWEGYPIGVIDGSC